MTGTVIAIAVLLILACCVSATLNLALRDLSLTRLTKALMIRQRENWLETFRNFQDQFIRATATVRMISMLGIVLVVAELFGRGEGIIGYNIEVVAVSAALILLCGLALPQPLAKYTGDSLLASALPLLRLMHLVTWPITVAMGALDTLIRRLAGVPKYTEKAETEQFEQDVLDAVHDAEIQGVVDRHEKDMIKSVMELNESTAGEIMTPRTDVVGINKQASLAELKELIRHKGHSRIPVYDETIDQVLGMVYAKDLLHVPEGQPFNLMQHIREVPFVPETKPLMELLREFRTGKTHAAIVLDEYGGTAGLVTIEDILEELVGEIADEYEQPEPEPIVRVQEHVIEVDSKVHVEEINDLLEVNIPEGQDYETIGGFVFSTLGKIPHSGEQLMHGNARITVLEAEERKICRLRIEVVPAEAGTGDRADRPRV